MTVEDLFIYPVKSLAGIRVTSAAVTARGFEHDRRWMIAGPDGTFKSQRSMPRLALIRTAIDGDSIRLESDTGSMRIPLHPHASGSRRGRSTVTIWGDEVLASPAAQEASEWLSDLVGESVELVWMPDDAERSPDSANSQDGDRVSFADGYPILLTATESLAELNRHLSEPVPMSRFRPNIVVRTTTAWEEETWRQVSTGVRSEGVRLDAVKPCGRCIVTTVPQFPVAADESSPAFGPQKNTGVGDGETAGGGSAQRRPESAGPDRSEPLRTLARIHRIDGKAVFGVNVIPRSAGTIQAGDELAVRKTILGA